MPSIVSSPLALRLAVALGQAPDGLTTSQLAASVAAPYTSVERALDILLADGIAARSDRRYILRTNTRAEATLRLAVAFLELAELLAIVSRANRAVEFCGVDGEGPLLVTRRFADLPDEVALRSFLALLREMTEVEVEVLDKGTLRDRLTVDDGPRRRASRMRILHGSLDRTFPDRGRHGDTRARPLGRLHPTLVVPSQRRMAALARRYHLRRVSAFGSATRADFRADSDVDLLVEPRSGHRPRLGEIVRLNSEAEDLFGRDVDLLVGPVRPELHARIEQEEVVLHDAGR